MAVGKERCSRQAKGRQRRCGKRVKDSPLDGVGLESWKLLWEQARAYSVANAYSVAFLRDSRADHYAETAT